MLTEMKRQVLNKLNTRVVRKYSMFIVVTFLVTNILIMINIFWEKQGVSNQKQLVMVNQACHDEEELLSTDTDVLVKQPVTLYVRMTGKHIKRFYCDLLRTTVLFWPASYGKLVVAFDDESSPDHKLAKILERQFAQFLPDRKLEILYEPLPRNHKDVLKEPYPRRGVGYNRQIWSSFYNDLYTNDTVIAWVDSDSAFSSPVTRNSMFNGTRLRVIGTDCTLSKAEFARICVKSAEISIGLPAVGDFMLHFPVYMYRDTYTNFREYLIQRYNATNFEEAYQNISSYGFICPVTTILNYAWHFERDRYDWSFKICSAPLNEYNKRFQANAMIRPYDIQPVMASPQTTVHTGNPGSALKSAQLILASYCFSHEVSGRINRTFCRGKRNLNPLSNNLVLLKYARAPEWCKGNLRSSCVEVLQRHYSLVGCELLQKKRRMEWSDVEVVEKLVKEVGHTCRVIHNGYPSVPIV